MKKFIACILLLIYSCFFAVAAWQAPTDELTDPVAFQNEFGYEINVCGKEQAKPPSHLETVNLKKFHHHHAPSRSYKIPRVIFPLTVCPDLITANIEEERKNNNLDPGSQLSYTPIFLKNCVLRIWAFRQWLRLL